MKKLLIIEIDQTIHTKIKSRAATLGLSIKVYVTRILLEKLINEKAGASNDEGRK